MRVCVIGAGYVGLVTATCLAEFGHLITCVDIDANKVAGLRKGIIPIFEPGLEELIVKNVHEGRLKFETSLADVIPNVRAVFIAVGTPPDAIDGSADLSSVFTSALQIAKSAVSHITIVVKSTVPVGTGDQIEDIVKQERPDLDFSVASNPEFLREGSAIGDFKRPDRIIVGTEDIPARSILSEIYRPLYINNQPILFVGRRTSELIKYAANAFLATKITFINEIADLCEKVGANVQEVARGIGLDNRIGSKFLHAGPGFGGSCFPKDTVALLRTSQEFNSPSRIVEAVVAVNEERKIRMGKKIIDLFGGSVRDKKIAVLGLAFKPNTDDMRDAPSIVIISYLIDAGAIVAGYDPQSMKHAQKQIPSIELTLNPYDCARNAEALVIVTEWEEFRALDFDLLKEVMRTPFIIDLRNIYTPSEVEGFGFRYHSIGR